MRANTIARLVAKIGRNSAMKSSGTASGYGTYQPKAPAALKKFAKKCK